MWSDDVIQVCNCKTEPGSLPERVPERVALGCYVIIYSPETCRGKSFQKFDCSKTCGLMMIIWSLLTLRHVGEGV